MIGTIITETIKGKSLGRIMQNIHLQSIVISGAGIDLGSKHGRSSYHRFLNCLPGTSVTFTDINPICKDVMQVDLEKKIPVEDESQDFLLCMNVLEHLFDHRACLLECNRVLKPSGSLIGSVPFLQRVHPDPADYFRYTESALRRLLSEAGFSEIKIEPLGFGPVTAGICQFSALLRFWIIILPLLLISIGIDVILNRFFYGKISISWQDFPLHYFFTAVK